MNGIRVIKLGGSLLDWPGLAAAFRKWRALQTPMCDLVVVGGGELVESIRRFDVAHGLCEQEAHWLAIDAMSVSARLVAALLPEAKLQLRVQPCFELDLSILDVRDFMQQDASSARPWGQFRPRGRSQQRRLVIPTRGPSLGMMKGIKDA